MASISALEFCVYDKMHDDYGYTQAWVDFLIGKLMDDAEFESLYKAVLPNVSISPTSIIPASNKI